MSAPSGIPIMFAMIIEPTMNPKTAATKTRRESRNVGGLTNLKLNPKSSSLGREVEDQARQYKASLC